VAYRVHSCEVAGSLALLGVQLMHLLPHANRCLEDQANASEMVRDVRIICTLTRCRSGLTGTTATGAGGARSWSSSPGGTHRILARARSSLTSRVRVPGTFGPRLSSGHRTGLTANSQGFRIGGTGKIALLKRCARALELRGGEGLGESEAES